MADEVGMGKTFVALAVAFSVLESMDASEQSTGLDGCYQKILIVTPPNGALFNKWNREVSEFVRRCVSRGVSPEARERFRPVPADRLDELVAAVRRRGGRGGRVVVTTMNVFGDRKLRNYDLKRRFLLGVIFRYWGARFNIDSRERLLKGAPDHWPTTAYHLTDLTEWEASQLPFSENEAIIALERLDRPSRYQALLEQFLLASRELSEPFRRDRQDGFKKIETYLTKVYRALNEEMLNRSFPLVIVDEAHNWKNGPSKGANGYANFAELIAERTRRLLLLTATPFQLRSAEMLEILHVSARLECSADVEMRQRRRARLVEHCQVDVKTALHGAEQAGRRFSKNWSRVPLSAGAIAEVWNSPALKTVRGQLCEPNILAEKGHLELQSIARDAVASLDPELRPFFYQALLLFAFNERLSRVLGKLVIRHRRHTEHRLTLVGQEYALPDTARARQDRHLLHAAPGLDVHGDGELPHYLLMRCVTALKQGKGRSSLGSALTGCYSTLLESAEGRRLGRAFGELPAAKPYFETLFSMVRGKDDPKHPKLSEVVEAATKSWRDGEKTLIFCFRVNTAQRLRDIIADRIRVELKQRRRKCLGGETALRTLRGRMTRREGDLVVLGLDRVLLSLSRTELASVPRRDLALQTEDVREIAQQALRYKQDLLGERVDRVFVHRAVEFAVAHRLFGNATSELRLILRDMSVVDWIEHPYGSAFSSEPSDSETEDVAHVDERGVHAYYKPVTEKPADRDIEELTRALLERRERARRSGSVPILDSYFEAPSLWLGPAPSIADQVPAALASLHEHLFHLTFGHGPPDWKTRLLVLQALRRALLRESMLLRLLPEKSDRDERGWGELLAERFLEPLPGQHESMADRMAIFAEDVLSASGSADNRLSARYNLIDATRLRDQNFVALVLGGGDQQARERIFAGFNTPLLPEILICTSVGAEGIDLHRHCGRVVHYDLAWNPAVLEQRTGRIDRIGSKTFREREAAKVGEGPLLEVGVPFLAGTYDERMFEELRMRAQTFEVLTGGDVTSDDDRVRLDDASGTDDGQGAEGREQGLRLKALPPEMLNDLRAKLHVWKSAQ
ncbi:helicase-related protein [Bradyrhizobium sp. AZCC 2262]|uniref:helicase-related protein n=1 Tax=Bradyrhizobium sp. AZCC 2262 TaxID=3117022 RepID=UPI002FEFDDB2